MHGLETLMAQPRHDPAFNYLDRDFDLSFVLRPPRPGREHRGAVMAREVEHGVVGARLIAVRIGNQGTRVIGHDQVGATTYKAQGAHHRADPIDHRLARRGAGEGVARCAQCGDEHMGTRAIGHRDGRASVVDKQLLAGLVDLAHRALQALGPRVVVLAELRVAVGLAAGVGVDILLPQQRQRDALATQLLMYPRIVRRHIGAAT